MIIIYIKYKWAFRIDNMNLTMTNLQVINDHCRFLLMEMGIGILEQTIKGIIEQIMDEFPNPRNMTILNEASICNYIMLKALCTVYDDHVTHYATQTGLFNLTNSNISNRPEQLIFLQQLSNRMAIKKSNSPQIYHFTIRESLQYLPAFQAKIMCYGVKPPTSDHCVPVHPWLWRKHLKYNFYENALPCIHHKRNWFPCADPFFLQDENGRFLSFKKELSIREVTRINQLFNSLALPYETFILPTESFYCLPIDDSKKMSVTISTSPFDHIEDNCRLLPLQSLCHPLIQQQIEYTYGLATTMANKPLELLKKYYGVQLDFYHYDPIFILKNKAITGIIYRHISQSTHNKLR